MHPHIFIFNIEKQSITKYTPFYLLYFICYYNTKRIAVVPRELDTENDTNINLNVTEENIKNVENDIFKKIRSKK